MSNGKVIWRESRGVYIAKFTDEHGKLKEKVVARPAAGSGRAKKKAQATALKQLAELEVEAAARKTELETIANDPFHAHATAPLETHLNDYVDFLASGGWKGRTSESYRKKTRYRIARVFETAGIKHIKDIDEAKIDSALLHLKDAMSEKTRKDYRDSVVSFGKWLKKRKRVATDPLAEVVKIQTKGADRQRRGWFTDDELASLVDAAAVRGVQEYRRTHPHSKESTLRGLEAKGLERGAVYRFAWTTALREDEIRDLRWSQVTIKGNWLTVRFRAEGTNKASRDDLVTIISPNLVTELKQRREEQAIHLKRIITGRDLVYTVPKTILRRLYDDMEFAEIAKIDDLGRVRVFHSLRHTAARRLILNGAKVSYIQAVMRHASYSMTMDLYGDLEVSELLDADPVEVPPLKPATQDATQMPPKLARNEAQ